MSRKVCISMDQSAVSRGALQYAAQHYVRGSDEVHLVTVLQPAVKSELAYGVGGRAPLVNDECAVRAEDLAQAQQLLEDCKELLQKAGVPGDHIIVQPLVACLGTSNDIAHHIVDYSANQGCDSLVVGSRGLGEAKKTMLSFFGLGSVSDYLVRHAPCNVIVHKEHAK